MKMNRTAISLCLLFLCAGSVSAATLQVTATGSCPTDLSAVRSAVAGANPGDTIQLLPGSPAAEFDFTCLSPGDTVGVAVNKVGLTLEGISTETVVRGPGFDATFVNIGFLVSADGVSFKEITFKDFGRAIGVGLRKNLTVNFCRFENNAQAVLATDADHLSLTHNTVQVPTPDLTPPFSSSVGFVILNESDDLLVADNTLSGPAPSFSVDLDNIADCCLGLFSAGIFQRESTSTGSLLGRISGNDITGFDGGIQSSSDFGVVTRNTINGSAYGIIVSDDTGDGSSQVTDNTIALNSVTNSDVGLWIASGARNVGILNDLSGNRVVGLLFLENLGGAPSEDNVFLRNKGSVKNVSGNQGPAMQDLLP